MALQNLATGRRFGEAGSLQPDMESSMQRRDAVSAEQSAQKRDKSMYGRVYRQLSQAGRRGDMRAAIQSLDVAERANQLGLGAMGGISSYEGNREQAAQSVMDQRNWAGEMNDAANGLDQPSPSITTPLAVKSTSPVPSQASGTGNASPYLVSSEKYDPQNPFTPGMRPGGATLLSSERFAVPNSTGDITAPNQAGGRNLTIGGQMVGASKSPEFYEAEQAKKDLDRRFEMQLQEDMKLERQKRAKDNDVANGRDKPDWKPQTQELLNAARLRLANSR